MKMNRFIFGFQRRVWCPKCTPASSRSFMLTSPTALLLRGLSLRPSARVREPQVSVTDVRDRDSSFLPLAELEPLARSRLSVLLPLLHARVAREQAFAAQGRTETFLLARQRAGDRHAQRARLTREPATVRPRQQVVLLTRLRDGQRLQGVPHQRIAPQVFVDRPVVHRVLAGSGDESHACHRLLAPSGGSPWGCDRHWLLPFFVVRGSQVTGCCAS